MILQIDDSAHKHCNRCPYRRSRATPIVPLIASFFVQTPEGVKEWVCLMCLDDDEKAQYELMRSLMENRRDR